MSKRTGTASKHIVMHPPEWEAIRDLTFGAGVRYQWQVLKMLLEAYQEPGETWVEAGRRLRRESQRGTP